MVHNCLSDEVVHEDLQRKVDVHYLVFDLKHTLVFEWCIVGCKSRNGHPKKCAEKRLDCMFIIVKHLKIAVNITEGTSTTIFMSMRNFISKKKKELQSPEEAGVNRECFANYERKVGTGTIWIC